MARTARRTETLIRRHAHLWKVINRNPFLAGIRDGKLPRQSFDRWLTQDRHFAEGMFVAQARILAKAPPLDRGLLLEGLGMLRDEIETFDRRIRRRHLDPQGAVHPVCRAYIDFLLSLAFEPYASGIVALWALERAYFEGWSGVRPGAPPYRDFVRRWTSRSFVSYVARLQAAAEMALEGASRGERAAAERTFVQAALYELDFWVMSLEERHP